MEWVRAAEAEADRVAQSHIVAANHANLDAPILPSRPAVAEFTPTPAIDAPAPAAPALDLAPPEVDDTPEFEQPTAEDADADEEPREVSGDEGALASATKRRVVRRR